MNGCGTNSIGGEVMRKGKLPCLRGYHVISRKRAWWVSIPRRRSLIRPFSRQAGALTTQPLRLLYDRRWDWNQWTFHRA